MDDKKRMQIIKERLAGQLVGQWEKKCDPRTVLSIPPYPGTEGLTVVKITPASPERLGRMDGALLFKI
ncbi:MAG: hypothetical protein M0Q92_07855 [Methanoregula sp.]|nr:hypothetical protein [Methanoregula sp.]